jgi:hypothetical protein
MKVAKQLQEKGATTFLPLMTQTHRWSDRHKVVELPPFPCYAFAHLALSVEMRLPVLQTPGVLSIFGARGEGAPIPDKENGRYTDAARPKRREFAVPLHQCQRVRIRVDAWMESGGFW